MLELAETLTLSQLEVVERALGELRDAGVRLALDDFGTGVSSLSVLSRIPVHQLKIDREFVAAVETSSEAAAVIRSTVDLARSLHLTVVAEGVESEPQRHALWELGCVAGQGHLFARPMRAGRMLAALQRGSGGRPGVLAGALHDAGAVVRMPRRRSAGSRQIISATLARVTWLARPPTEATGRWAGRRRRASTRSPPSSRWSPRSPRRCCRTARWGAIAAWAYLAASLVVVRPAPAARRPRPGGWR